MTNWDEVVRQHAALVSRIALRILGRAADAEDVCQDVFLEAYRFGQSSRVRNWAAFLSRVATVRALDRLRNLRPTFPLTGSEPSSRICSPPDAAIAGELASRLRQALAQLPQQQGVVFSLRYFESLTNAEIAQALDISSSAVSTALFKARAGLDTLLNDVPQEAQMNTLPTHDEFDLEGPLREAVLQILAEPIPADVAARVVGRASQLNQRPRSRRPRLVRRLLVGTALAASVLLAIAIFHSLQDRAWAQVQEAVAHRRWLHAKGTSIDTKQIVEFWFSAVDGILVERYGDQMEFFDLRQQFWDSYKMPGNDMPGNGAKAVYRTPLSPESRQGVDAVREMFAALATGDLRVALTRGGQQAIKFTHQDVPVGDRTVPEFHITTQSPGGAVIESILRVDPATRLPQSWKYQGPRDDNGVQFGWQCDFDYPDSGPQTIYAAGVPADVPLVDQIPKGDDRRLLDGVALARTRLDSYYAVVIDSLNTDPRQPNALSCRRIWRKGNKWRVEFCRSPQNGKPLPADADPAAWWKQHVEQLRSYPESISDGTRVCTFSAVPTNPVRPDPQDRNWVEIASFDRSFQPLTFPYDPWPNNNLAEFNARHQIGPMGPGYRVTVDWAPADGPTGSVRVDVLKAAARPGQQSGNRFWIDPLQDHLVVKNGLLKRADNGQDVLQDPAPEVVDVCTSPSGRLYPTLVRMPNGSVQMETNQKSDNYQRFYYDFKASIPDELFDTSK